MVMAERWPCIKRSSRECQLPKWVNYIPIPRSLGSYHQDILVSCLYEIFPGTPKATGIMCSILRSPHLWAGIGISLLIIESISVGRHWNLFPHHQKYLCGQASVFLSSSSKSFYAFRHQYFFRHHLSSVISIWAQVQQSTLRKASFICIFCKSCRFVAILTIPLQTL